MNIWTLIRFRKDDPMRYLHVPKRDRLDDDGDDEAGDGSTALDGGDDTDFDRDEVRGDPLNRGRVMPPEALQ